jgi:hypothetical protein
MFAGHSMLPPQHAKAARWGPGALPLRMQNTPQKRRSLEELYQDEGGGRACGQSVVVPSTGRWCWGELNFVAARARLRDRRPEAAEAVLVP